MRGVALLLALAAGSAGAVTRIADTLVIDGALDDDLYAAAGEVDIRGSVAGSASFAAGTASLSGDIAGDMLAAAGRIDMAGGVGDDLRAAGGRVRVTGFVTDQATIAGGSVTIAPGCAIGGRTFLAGGNVEMAGQVGADLHVAAGTLSLSGRVAGDVEVTAREIRIEPGAVIGGDLVWRGDRPPQIADDARIFGEVRQAGDAGPEFAATDSDTGFDGRWVTGIALLVAGLVLLWFAPGLTSRATAVFRGAPLRTVGLGAAALLLVPIVAVVLFATVLGWLLGLLVLAAYLFGLLLAGLLGVLIAAQLLRARQGGVGAWRTVLLMLVVVLGLMLAQSVPVLGSLLAFVLLLAGLGALTALLTGRAALPPAA